jgi:hypothetical protein
LGITTHKIACAAIAASAAVPPAPNISWPAATASGWAAETAPLRPRITPREVFIR